ncbi:MAG: type II secretion system F family protein [Nitrospirae bacterium]|nr:MAG: type II secretion system F family protein [Nitrospirota bacterium]
MARFRYRAARQDGTIIEASATGPSEMAVRSQLETDGLLILELKGESSWNVNWHFIPQRKRLSLRDFLVFNQQFLALVKSGLPILKTFDILTERATYGPFQQALYHVREKIRGGAAISQAMAAEPRFFPELYQASIQAGEQTGNLIEVLQRYIAYLKLVISVREKIVKALAYPAFLIVVGAAVVSFLVMYVIPTFAEVYEQNQTALPLPTQILLDLLNSANMWGPLVGGGLLVTGAGVYWWAKTPAGQFSLHALLLKAPVVGTVIQKSQIIRLTRTLSTILAGGIPLLSALTITAHATTNKVIAQALLQVTDRVRDGASLATSLKEAAFLPRLAVEMIEVGETTGSLETMLLEVAEFHEGELDLLLGQLTTWIEPVLLLIMGVIIGGIVIIMYLPIFQLAGTV